MKRLRHCGRRVLDGSVELRLVGETAGWAGLETCGSVWVCPVCSAKIMARRGVEIAAGVQEWTERSGQIILSTFTIRHNAGMRLEDLWDALMKAWHAIGKRNKAGRQDWALWGTVGSIRAVEVVRGENGWHVHVHVLWFVSGEVSEDAVQAVHNRMVSRWDRALRRYGFDSLPEGQKSLLTNGAKAVGMYLAKLPGSIALGHELTNTESKAGRSKGATVWEIAAAAIGGDKAAQAAWWEYEAASKGRRQLAWSRGLRALLGLTAEQSDEDVAAAEIGTEEDAVCYLAFDAWRSLLGHRGLAVYLLRVLEQEGWIGAASVLDQHGIEYTRNEAEEGKSDHG